MSVGSGESQATVTTTNGPDTFSGIELGLGERRVEPLEASLEMEMADLKDDVRKKQNVSPGSWISDPRR